MISGLVIGNSETHPQSESGISNKVHGNKILPSSYLYDLFFHLVSKETGQLYAVGGFKFLVNLVMFTKLS